MTDFRTNFYYVQSTLPDMHLYSASLSNKCAIYHWRTPTMSVCIRFLELLWIKSTIMKLSLSAAW